MVHTQIHQKTGSDISADERELRQRESVRHGRRGGHQGADNSEWWQEMGKQHQRHVMISWVKDPVERRRGVGIMGRRTGTPRWEDYPVRRRNRQFWRTEQEADSLLERSLTEVGADRVDENNSLVTISYRAYSRSSHWLRLELHHLMIRSHCTDRFPVNNNTELNIISKTLIKKYL